jgi:hypothetical protein
MATPTMAYVFESGQQEGITMALYKYSAHLYRVEHAEFDKMYPPGAITAWSGIYRCVGCGREIVHTINKPLPPQNHHQHTGAQGPILWRLVVTDSPDPK